MRILIYSETEAAKVKQAALRKEGHHASLRNPYYFNPAQFDKACDQIVADDQAILDAYLGAGIAIERLTSQEEAQPEPTPVQTGPIDMVKTRRVRKPTEE